MMIKYILMFFLIVSTSFSQSGSSIISSESAQTLIKGKVTDIATGKPLEVEIELKPAKGNKIKIKSNAITGLFEQIVPSNMEIDITVYANDVLRQEFQMKSKAATSGQFTEQEYELKVIHLAPGTILDKMNVFSGNAISENGKKSLDGLKKLLRFNRYLTIFIEVQGNSDAVIGERITELRAFLESLGPAKNRVMITKNLSSNQSNEVFIKVDSLIEAK